MTFTLAPDVSLTDVGDSMVLLDEKGGRYWQLNATGAMVLRRLLAGAQVAEIVETLSERHPAAADRVASDVEAIIEALRAAKVVTR
ncbi:lasso peptide biosynthesis PqqD family chaperone [Actinoalloteichus hymeniacidonis]|uniref:Coenzyme PQQ synthesis protein D (PqqD) n=1 Tax=Actinoalloteichus hymeniacidonis TaxID=340345 RepID=A0AAC9MXW1_9PSEU|nr:lasso peptide biosynthesis PqqD family chaperone [Actinoalloteichus hymeniacidonis]AOS62357.1 Coenzyme PQQ synthesis protein D (PqqD) [Actinoalloteichus hymeniacidonis]MBB5909615.1 hypothetical protein [Actinoalloteichus hymeniacidonis]